MKVGFIGAGKMAEAIIASLVSSRGAHHIFASEIDSERRKKIKRAYGINVYTKSISVLESADIVFLAVKPQDLDDALKEMAPHITEDHTFISIAAGKKIADIEKLTGKARVVRVMPNLATFVAEGMTVFCKGKSVSAKEKKTVIDILSRFGKVLELPESKFDAVTALSGSGPAFFAYFLKVMVDASVKEGLSKTDAILMAEQTMLGTAKLMLERNIEPQDLIDSVTSPNGTTAAGMKYLDNKELKKSIAKTIKAAAARAKELSH